MDEAKNQINDMEHKETKQPHNNKGKKRIQKNEDCARSLWDNVKHTNIYVIGVPEGEDKEQETGNLFEKNNNRKLP